MICPPFPQWQSTLSWRPVYDLEVTLREGSRTSTLTVWTFRSSCNLIRLALYNVDYRTDGFEFVNSTIGTLLVVVGCHDVCRRILVGLCCVPT